MKDPFGKVLLDYFRGSNPHFKVVRDDGHEGDELTASKYFTSREVWPEPERKIIEEAQERILDVGAGAGKHSLYLQERCSHVKAIDKSPRAVEVMRKRGVNDVEQKDLTNLDYRPGTFDTILLLGNNFGLEHGNLAEMKAFLKKLCKMTSYGAKIIATTKNPSATDSEVHKLYHAKNEFDGKLPGSLKLRVIYNEEKGDWFQLLLLGEESLMKLVKETKWELRKKTEEFDGLYGFVLQKEQKSWHM